MSGASRHLRPAVERLRYGRALSKSLLLIAAVIAAACSNVPVHRTLPPMNLGEPAFFPTLEAHAQAPIVGGNRLTLLLNGEQIYPAILRAIRSARTTITYAQYSYEDGQIARDVAEALAERCRAGVKAHVLLDSVGTLTMPREYWDLMAKAGCQVVSFRPDRSPRPRPCQQPEPSADPRRRRPDRLHGRLGVSSKWMGNGRVADHWRDTDVQIEGPVVEYLQGAFAENWVEATGVVLGGADYFPASDGGQGPDPRADHPERPAGRQLRHVHHVPPGALSSPAARSRSRTRTCCSTTR